VKEKVDVILILMGGEYGGVRDVKKIKFDYNINTTFNDLQDYVNSKIKFDNFNNRGGLCLWLEVQTKNNLIFALSQENGYIDWNLDVEKLQLFKIISVLKLKFITVYCDEPKGCPGGDLNFLNQIFSWIEHVAFLFSTFKLAFIFFSKLITKNKAYSLLLRDMDYRWNKENIKNFILRSNTWNKGFIMKRNRKLKDTIEKKIMKDLDYKLVDGLWILKEEINSSKTKESEEKVGLG